LEEEMQEEEIVPVKALQSIIL